MELLFLVIPLLFALGYVVTQHNGLVTLRNHIAESWSDIDTELKRRYELIPNLVSVVKAYAVHEREVLERLTQLRVQQFGQTPTARRFAHEGEISDAVRQMLAVVENYPALKADDNFRRLHEELVITENRIQASRRFYNGNVRDYRNKREAIPSKYVADVFGFGNADFFAVDPIVRRVPTASGLPAPK